MREVYRINGDRNSGYLGDSSARLPLCREARRHPDWQPGRHAHPFFRNARVLDDVTFAAFAYRENVREPADQEGEHARYIKHPGRSYLPGT